MLTDTQRDLVTTWAGPFHIIEDLSWGLVDSYVVRARTASGDIVIKTAGPTNNHLAREINGYASVGPGMCEAGWLPAYLGGDARERILVTSYVEGDLAEVTGVDRDPDVVRQAGQALKLLHSLDHGVDETLEKNLTKSALSWLAKPHRIPTDQVARARDVLTSVTPVPVATVACHGDYSGRNWIVGGGKLTVIDLGRFGHRPPSSDLLRMYDRHWRHNLALREAFSEGYGPLDELMAGDQWKISVLREAISTAAWAHKVGDEEFETEGLAQIGPALEQFE